MSLVLQSTGGGQITIQEPATASNFTATLPAATGTVMVSGNMPAFSAWQSSAQTLSSGVATLVQFNTEEFDTANCFNNTGSTVTLNGLSTPAYAFCPNVAGYYQFIFNAYMGVQSSGQQGIFYRNGAVSKFCVGTGSTLMNGINNTALIYLNGTGDYVQAYLSVSIGQSLSAGQTVTYFSASMVRSA
jgi:hypothetical protein